MLKHHKDRDMEKDNKRINYLFVSFILGLTILFGSSLFVDIQKEFSSINDYATIEGKASYNKDLLFRRWASMHGGVYVPITDETPPNSALSHIPDRDITSENGVKLTLVNPAYMTRQVHEIAGRQYGVKGHITSLNPIRPENRPDEWETRALHLFETGESEYSSLENIDGKNHLRFMHAMTVEQNCLKCHAVQGYKVGDIRGGISVSVPMDVYEKEADSQIKMQIATYSSVYAVVLFFTGWGFKHIKKEIVHRHLQQAKTIESESLLSQSQEIAHIGSWSLDLTTNNLYWSDEVYRIFGCEPQEFPATYETFLEFTHPDDRAAVDEAYFRKVSEGSNNYDIEHRILRQSTGEIRHVHERCVHVRDDTGAIIKSIGMLQDITERKQAEEALRQSRQTALNLMADAVEARDLAEQASKAMWVSEESYRTLFSEMQNGFAHSEIICDGQGRPINSRYLSVNPAFERITGRKAEDVVGKTIYEVFPALEPEWMEMFGSVALTGEPAHFEMSAAELGVTFEVAAFRPAPNQYACTFSDITARMAAEVEQRRLLDQAERASRAMLSALEDQRQSQEALRESNSLLRVAGCMARFGGWSVNLAEGKTTWSDEVARIHDEPPGYSPALTDGIKYYAPEWREKITAVFGDCTRDGTPYDEEMQIITARGRRVWVRTIGEAVRDAAGAIVQVQGAFQDITERKEAENKILRLNEELEDRVRERTAQLEAVNKELETFSYSVSHDLKAPLRGIDGYSQLLEKDYFDRLDDEGKLFIRNIRDSAGQMHQLIEDLLQYSRMERRTMQNIGIDLSALVQAIAAEQRAEAEQAGIQLRLEVPAITVRADRDGLAIVLRNLLENAIKFSGNAQAPTVEIGARTESCKVILWVRDNGIGFDMKFHDRIFEIFQRLQRAEDYPGTGIGLSLVRKAMGRMGGRVWAESTPGGGATFFLEIPL